MKIDIVAIGNSRGIRQAELRVENGRIILQRPGARPGWSEAFEQMAEAGDDRAAQEGRVASGTPVLCFSC